MKKERTTLKNIAEKADVSISTVSRALRDDDRIAEATREHIRVVAQELGFTVRLRANGDLGEVVVLVLDTGWGAFFDKTLNELARQGEKRNFKVSVQSVERHEPLTEGLARVAHMNSGVVVIGTWDTISSYETDLISSLSVPVIFINRYIETCASAVTLDDFGAGITAARYLVGLGHKRIAYLPGMQASSAMRDRLRGFQTGLQRMGVYVPELITEPLSGNVLEWTCRSVKQLMDLPQPPTAIWTCNDIAASAVIVSLRTQGFAVPEQISVIGHDHLPQAREIGITTFDYRLTELGYHVAYLAEGFLRDELSDSVHISLMPKLVEGHTTGPSRA